MVPDALWQHPTATPLDLKVWCALLLHAKDSEAIASTNASLAESAGVSIPTLKRSLSRLVGTGFVRMEGDTHKRVIYLCPDAVEVVYTLRLAHR